MTTSRLLNANPTTIGIIAAAPPALIRAILELLEGKDWKEIDHTDLTRQDRRDLLEIRTQLR